jgi:hypothetical protein
MKKIFAAFGLLYLLATNPVLAQRYEHHYHHHNQPNWVAPFIGGALGGAIIGSMVTPPGYYQPVCFMEIWYYDYYGNPVYRRVCR